MMNMNLNGCVLWRGPSEIDGQRIALVATGYVDPSSNSKTGPMLQTWILVEGVNPQMAALQTGLDVAICGSCAYRADPLTGERRCYVALWQAPRSIYDCLRDGRYPECFSPDDIAAAGAGQIIRCGAYGDPAAVPAWVWAALLQQAAGWTGYTHQWRHRSDRVRANAAALKPYMMASVEGLAEYQQAQAQGWRTFRLRHNGELLPGERTCPASREAGHLTDCYHCRACSGWRGRGSSSIAINEH